MHVLHVVDFYYPKIGGLEVAVQHLAEEQTKLGYQVEVVTSNVGASNRPKEEVINRVNVVRVRARKLLYDDLTMPLEIPPIKEANVIHVHTQNSLFCLKVAQYAKKKLGKSIIYQFIAVDYTREDPRLIIKFLGSLYQEWIQRKSVALASTVITLNRRDYQLVKSKFGIESCIVPHGIDEKYLTKPKDDSVFREKYGVQSGNIVAYVGRVHPSKGLDILIKALPLIAREVDDFIAVIAGGGSKSYRQKLSKLAKKLEVEHKVKLLGYISEDEKISLLDSSKVLVFPTRHFGEAYPLVIDEAYARNVPIVATKVGILPYRVKHMETGMLIPPDDPSLLAKSVVALLKDGDLFAKMCRKLQSIKGSMLTWRQICERLGEVYGMAKG